MNYPKVNKIVPKLIHQDVKFLKDLGYDCDKIIKLIENDGVTYPDFLIDMQSSFESECMSTFDDEDEADDYSCDPDYNYYAILKNYCERKINKQGCARFCASRKFF